MNHKTKRIIAREILLAFSIIAIFFIVWGVLALREVYYADKSNTLRKKGIAIESEIDSIFLSTLVDVNELIAKPPQKVSSWDEAVTDTPTRMPTMKSILDSLESTKTQIFNDRDKSDRNRLHAGVLEYSLLFLFTLIIICYPIRLVYHLIRWAINILKTSNQ